MSNVKLVLQNYGMGVREKQLFQKLIQAEGTYLLGYHGGSCQVRLFQDILYYTLRDLIQIPIRHDFVFLRVPNDNDLKFENALDFIQEKAQHLTMTHWDNQPEIQKHILSLNLSLYQSHDQPWDLTPRYFLENQTWTNPPFVKFLIPFFQQLGINAENVYELWEKGEQLLPANRGFILQVFDRSEDFAFAKKCSYAAFSGGKPHRDYKDHHHLYESKQHPLPQIRLVLAQKTTLNPNCPLSFKRYDAMDATLRKRYIEQLRSLIKQLPYDRDKVKLMKLKLLDTWRNNERCITSPA